MDISDLNSKIDKLEGVVKQLERGKKDRWDKFQIFASLLIPASIALAGYFVSASLKMAEIKSAKLIADGNLMSARSIALGQQKVAEINAKVAQAQLVLSYLEILTGENPKKRKLAIESILIALPINGKHLVSTVAINDESEDVKRFARLKLESIDLEIKDYQFFQNTAYLKFNPDSKSFDIVNAYWLIEAAMIVYMEDHNFIREKFIAAGLNDVVLIRGRGDRKSVV